MKRFLTALVIKEMQILYQYSTLCTGEVTQWVNPEDLGLGSQDPYKKLGMVEESCDPTTRRALWTARTANQQSPGSVRNPLSKK